MEESGSDVGSCIGTGDCRSDCGSPHDNRGGRRIGTCGNVLVHCAVLFRKAGEAATRQWPFVSDAVHFCYHARRVWTRIDLGTGEARQTGSAMDASLNLPTEGPIDQIAKGRAFFFSRGRTALYSILRALGIGRGDEVILQAFTCLAV